MKRNSTTRPRAGRAARVRGRWPADMESDGTVGWRAASQELGTGYKREAGSGKREAGNWQLTPPSSI